MQAYLEDRLSIAERDLVKSIRVNTRRLPICWKKAAFQ
jgi:hypothetical protein